MLVLLERLPAGYKEQVPTKIGTTCRSSDYTDPLMSVTSSAHWVAGSIIAAKPSVWRMQQSFPPIVVQFVPQLALHSLEYGDPMAAG